MNPYLHFELGDISDVRGRAIICVQNTDQSINKIVDINNTALKEAIMDEILQGRLISLDIFEPLYLKVNNLPPEIQNIQEYAHKEFRELITVPMVKFPNLDFDTAMERAVNYYLTICREKIYLRVLEELANVLFRRSRHSGSPYYVPLFRLAQCVCNVLKFRRENDLVEMEYVLQALAKHSIDLPYIDLKYIEKILVSGNGRQGQEMADYLDTFYLTLKKYFPYSDEGFHFIANAQNQKWLENSLPSLYCSFFHCLFYEKYEKAASVKQEIDNLLRDVVKMS